MRRASSKSSFSETDVSSSHPTDFQGSVVDAIREAIEQQVPGARAAATGGEGHFEIDVESPVFAGKSTLESHRIVYRAIAHLMKGDAPAVHAVDRLTTRTPVVPLPKR